MERLSARVRVNDQGRIVLPAALRCKVGIEPGDTIVATVVGDTIVLRTFDAALTELQNAFTTAAPGRSLAAELIAERRAEAAREAVE